MTEQTARYRHRTAEVEAVQWTGSNADQLRAFCGPDFDEIDLDDRTEDPDETAAVREGKHGTWRGLRPGDWVVKLDEGLYEFSAADFAEQYEPAGQAPATDQAGVAAVRVLHQSMSRAGFLICAHCSGWNGVRCLGVVADYPCPTIAALDEPPSAVVVRRATDETPGEAQVQLPFIHVDDDGDQLDIGAVMASTYDGEAPVVYVAAEQHQGDTVATVYVRPERVDEVIAALRSARLAAETLPAVGAQQSKEA
jgi:hypothetical protein